MLTITSKHLEIARKVASRFARGNMSGHYDDLIGVAYVRLAEIANKESGSGDFNVHAYMQCKYAILNYLRSKKSGRIGGLMPAMLDGMSTGIAESLVHDSRELYTSEHFERAPVPRKPQTAISKNGRGKGGNKLKTHCAKGHEYTPENTRIRTGKRPGRRVCRKCASGKKTIGCITFRSIVRCKNGHNNPYKRLGPRAGAMFCRKCGVDIESTRRGSKKMAA